MPATRRLTGASRRIFILMAAAALAAPSIGQTPPAANGTPARPPSVFDRTPTNLTVMPATTTPAQLRGAMLAFSSALGVRCTHCHTGTEETPLAERDFASDDNPRKAMARAMMQMTWALNSQTLSAIEGLNQPRVSCYSCHRGAVTPALTPPPPPPAPVAPPAAVPSPAPGG